MKRFEVVTFTDFSFKASFQSGFFDRRSKKDAWKWVAFNWGRWKFMFNYGYREYGDGV